MTKHYSAPELTIIELRLTDVIMQSDEWEGPILMGAPRRDELESAYGRDLNEEVLQ